MKRMTVLLLAALSLLAGAALPARAQASWEDPKGDATAVLDVESTPRPNDAELDIVKARYEVVGDSVVATIQVEKLGVAPGSGGSAKLTFTA